MGEMEEFIRRALDCDMMIKRVIWFALWTSFDEQEVSCVIGNRLKATTFVNIIVQYKSQCWRSVYSLLNVPKVFYISLVISITLLLPL